MESMEYVSIISKLIIPITTYATVLLNMKSYIKIYDHLSQVDFLFNSSKNMYKLDQVVSTFEVFVISWAVYIFVQNKCFIFYRESHTFAICVVDAIVLCVWPISVIVLNVVFIVIFYGPLFENYRSWTGSLRKSRKWKITWKLRRV